MRNCSSIKLLLNWLQNYDPHKLMINVEVGMNNAIFLKEKYKKKLIFPYEKEVL